MDREEAFRRAIPLDPGRTGLLVVDMQRGFALVVATLWLEIQRATLDIIRRAYARVLSAKELGDMLRSTP